MFSVNCCSCDRCNAVLQLCKVKVSKQRVLVVGPREGEWPRASSDEDLTFSAHSIWIGKKREELSSNTGKRDPIVRKRMPGDTAFYRELFNSHLCQTRSN